MYVNKLESISRKPVQRVTAEMAIVFSFLTFSTFWTQYLFLINMKSSYTLLWGELCPLPLPKYAGFLILSICKSDIILIQTK